MKSVDVNMLWVYGQLEPLAVRCMSTFVNRGYHVVLWSYDAIGNAPDGVDLRDAREILAENLVFLNQQQSFAGFSDLFRYAVLRKMGGLYCDVDVVAIKPADELPPIPFLVTERLRDGGVQINGSVIHVPEPRAGNIIDLAYAYATVFPKECIAWSEIGPALLTAIVKIHPRHGFRIMRPHFANAVDWWDCPRRLLADEPVPDCFFLHLYNETWRRAGVAENASIDKQSLVSRALAPDQSVSLGADYAATRP